MVGDFGLLIRDILQATEVVTDQFAYERRPDRDGSMFTMMMGLKLIQLANAHDALKRADFVEMTVEPERHSWEEWQAIRQRRQEQEQEEL